jgi:hypothetical protein
MKTVSTTKTNWKKLKVQYLLRGAVPKCGSEMAVFSTDQNYRNLGSFSAISLY